MAEKTYTEQQNIKYKKKLNELLDILPDFCTQYFDSLEFNKQPRTKVAYAMDIKGFFDNIDHELLILALEKHNIDRWIMLHVKQCRP